MNIETLDESLLPAPRSLEERLEQAHKDSMQFYRRACVRELERLGTSQEQCINYRPENDDDRWRAWICDSMVVALDALLQRDYVMALRCTLQCADYVGRLRGFWPTPATADGYIFLRNALEIALQDRP